MDDQFFHTPGQNPGMDPLDFILPRNVRVPQDGAGNGHNQAPDIRVPGVPDMRLVSDRRSNLNTLVVLALAWPIFFAAGWALISAMERVLTRMQVADAADAAGKAAAKTTAVLSGQEQTPHATTTPTPGATGTEQRTADNPPQRPESGVGG